MLVNRMRDQHNRSFANQAYCLPSGFAAYDTILLNHRVGIVEDFNGIVEVDAMLALIALGLRFIPRKQNHA